MLCADDVDEELQRGFGLGGRGRAARRAKLLTAGYAIRNCPARLECGYIVTAQTA